MRKNSVINFIEMKRKMGSVLIWMMLVVMAIFSLEVYADTIIGGTERQIANEKTIVRTSAQISRGSSTNKTIEKTTLVAALDKYAGTGTTTVSEKSSTTLLVKFSRTGNEYEIDVNSGPLFEEIGIIPPYVPSGYTQVEGTNLENGFVIEDSNGNQYVWVEVPKTEAVYQTAGLKITDYTGEDYTKIENDLKTYTATYRNGTTYVDEYYSNETTGLTSSEYNRQKRKMLKSIYKNGGFYVGRYETGIDYSEDARTAAGDTTQTPVIKQNAYPYNYVTTSQAQELSEGFATEGYNTSLMFGVQRALIAKYLETKLSIQDGLTETTTSWGNVYNNSWNITNTSSKYSENGTTWTSSAYGQKDNATSIFLSTGASDAFCKQNIYDLVGNAWEWTLEYNSGNSESPCVMRGQCYLDGTGKIMGSNYAVTNAGDLNYIGFRVALYKDEGTGADGTNQETPTYIPVGYTQVEGTDMETGFVIQDSKGNQYVWVEVPQTATVYPTAGLSITSFTDDEYTKIENDLKTYTTVYRNGTTYTDTWSSQEATGLAESQYNTQKKKMLKSIYKNGGFYVGRYETGIENSYRTAAGTITQTPVIKQNAYPYNYVTTSQAQALSSTFASDGYTSSLMFGVQWDLVLKYMETKGASQGELNTDSTSWGNYKNGTYNIENASAKYLPYNEATGVYGSWTAAPYIKNSGEFAMLTTGASDVFSKQNISDLAGNAWERTLEYTSNTTHPCSLRGATFIFNGTIGPANYRAQESTESCPTDYSFRVALYKDEGIAADSTITIPTYIPAGYKHVAGTSMDNGFAIQDSNGNQYVWVEVPQTTTVYPTAGLGVSAFTEADFKKIENDLHTYTSVYRNGTTYLDEYNSDEAAGLTESEYYIQKKKMLKSIYKNGGFYVGRYETGIDYSGGPRTASGNTTQTPVIQKNAYPYNYVTNSQSQILSSSFATEEYTSSLMFGVQWDLVLKYLETKGVTQTDLNEDSTSWGNYNNNLCNIINKNAKYSTDNGSTWISGAYGEKTSSASILLSTRASDRFCKQNISDLAGNMWEWTLENPLNTFCLARGGSYTGSGTDTAVAKRPSNAYAATEANFDNGFRVALYKDEWETMDEYIRYYDASNLDGNGTTATATTTWKDLAGEYDAQIYGSPTFGDGYISLNEGTSSEVQYIDIGPILDRTIITMNLKFSVNEIEEKNMCLIGNWQSGGIGFYMDSSGKIVFELMTDSGTTYNQAISSTIIEKDTIYDVTALYDGAYMYLYINGTLEAKTQTSGEYIKNPVNNENMVIGANPYKNQVDATGFAKMKVYSASVSPFVKHPEGANYFSPSMLETSRASWNGTLLKIDTSSINSDPTNQALWIQKCTGWTWIADIKSVTNVGSVSATFTKNDTFDALTILLWGNSGHGAGKIDVSSLTNGTTYTLKFDVTEYGNYTATITNIGIYEQE